MSRTLRPLAAFAMVALISAISAGCGSNAPSETGTGRPPDHARVAAAAISSPRTVEYHLHKVLGKLDISSRTELGGALPGGPNAPLPV
jgi:hypothetical protein